MCFKGDVRRGYFKNTGNGYLLNTIIGSKLLYTTIKQIDYLKCHTSSEWMWEDKIRDS